MLFVCSGNICRSPFAEAVARRHLGGDVFEVSSAGTFLIEGKPPPPEALRAASEAGFDIAPHRSRAATADLLRRAGLVYGMDRSHLEAITAAAPEATATLLDPDGDDIDDPYGRDIAVYRRVYRRIVDAVESRLDEWSA